MNNENYIVINGKRFELTEEQLKQLGIEVKPEKNNPFNRVTESEHYYFVLSNDCIDCTVEECLENDQLYFDNANYFNDKRFATQVMLHQQLYRKLLKYSYDNNAEVTKEDWKKIIIASIVFIMYTLPVGFMFMERHLCSFLERYISLNLSLLNKLSKMWLNRL